MSVSGGITSWWDGLESRERKMLLLGGVFGVVATLYMFVYPVFSAHTAARNTAAAADQDYRWLNEQINILAQMRDRVGGILPVSLPAAEIRQKIESDMKNKEIEGQVEIEDIASIKRVRVKLERAPGEKLMNWLEELANNGYVIATVQLHNSGGFLTGTISVGG